MRLNRFADWSQEEFETVMLPNKARKAELAAKGLLQKVRGARRAVAGWVPCTPGGWQTLYVARIPAGVHGS